jgi:hypothetical protein
LRIDTSSYEMMSRLVTQWDDKSWYVKKYKRFFASRIIWLIYWCNMSPNIHHVCIHLCIVGFIFNLIDKLHLLWGGEHPLKELSIIVRKRRKVMKRKTQWNNSVYSPWTRIPWQCWYVCKTLFKWKLYMRAKHFSIPWLWLLCAKHFSIPWLLW